MDRELFTLADNWQARLESVLKRGSIKFSSHGDRFEGTCVMEAVAYIAGDAFSDQPKCTAWSLTALAIWINDKAGSGPEDTKWRNKHLKPVIPDLLNTSSRVQRSIHTIAYSDTDERFVDDEHDDKVQAYILNQVKLRFGIDYSDWYDSTTTDGMALNAAFNFAYDTATDKRACLREMVAILKDSARYAKELLGEDVTAPVTVYASEGVIPARGDNFVDDIPVVGEEAEQLHEEIYE